MVKNFMHMEHPSLSRRHALLLLNRRTSQVFVYDHGSTHGTQLNYKPVKAFEFHEVSDGDILKFGESSRIVLAHINEDEEDDEEEDIDDKGIAAEMEEAEPVSKPNNGYKRQIEQALL